MQEWQAFSHNFSRLTLLLFRVPRVGANDVFSTNKNFYVRKMTPPLRPLGRAFTINLNLLDLVVYILHHCQEVENISSID
jgi:hypothetical protein